jgi:hypothetical protein
LAKKLLNDKNVSSVPGACGDVSAEISFRHHVRAFWERFVKVTAFPGEWRGPPV